MEDELLLDWCERFHSSVISVLSENTIMTVLVNDFFLPLFQALPTTQAGSPHKHQFYFLPVDFTRAVIDRMPKV
jgi:hypothetical protein